MCSEVVSSVSSVISGIPGNPIEDIQLSNIVIQHKGGSTQEDAGLQLTEKEKDYPEPNMFGRLLPMGFFVRHVNGIEVSKVKIIAESGDARPAVVLSDVKGADFSHLVAGAVFALHDVEDFRLSGSKGIADVNWNKVTDKKV